MELQDHSPPIPSTVPAASPDSAVNHPQPSTLQPPPQENGASASTTTTSTSTNTSQVSSEGSATPDSSVASSGRIPKLSAATAELLARANGNLANPHICVSDSDATMNTSNDTTTGTSCITIAETKLETSVSTALEKEKARDNVGAKDVAISTSSSSLPNGTMATDILSQQQQQPITSGINNVHIAIKPDNNAIPTAPNPTGAMAAPLRDIAPHPTNNTPLATPASGPKRQRTITTRRRRSGPKGVKRRRTGRNNAEDDDGVIKAGDSSSDRSADEATPITTQTKSGRQIHRPTVFVPAQPAAGSGSPTVPEASSSSQPRKRRRVYRKGKEVNVICKRCERGHSPVGNMIVFCDDCNRPWHQFCHDPPIGKEVITVKEMEWFCKECRPIEFSSDEMPPPSNVQRATNTNRIDTTDYLPTLPSGTKIGGAQFSLEQKKGYLCSLSHSHLVDILLNISTSTPDLPIFPENLLDLPSSTLLNSTPQAPTIHPNGTIHKPPLATAESTTSISTLTTQNSLTTSESSIDGRRQPPPPPLFPAIAEASGTSTSKYPRNAPSDNEADEDEYLYIEDHRLYPKAGNGFRLPPDSEDLDMLLEDPACPTFSHSLHGPAKARMEAGMPAMVVGSTA
ncbi:hypothetical protein AJ79_06498 [Helicocarpus griseus UAMH5409]|uniref:PHD-type domain-containing protein n=1 Tax=Helicocarpus griseus UAMH5409 TaxID=1447875 RepID=A0A2B7XCB7_9EURO|nr:hypothetical protein AJ79_06498 [Helicocarpus griseus UAMH5409]